MTGLSTERLSLHLLTVDEGRRIVEAAPGEQDVWAGDFPMQDDRDGAAIGTMVKEAEGLYFHRQDVAMAWRLGRTA